MHGVCTEGRLLLNVGDRGGENGLRPPPVREAGVAASGRPQLKRPRLAWVVRPMLDRREPP